MADINNPSLVPQVPRAAEDAAGEGGEAVATFSNYKAPLWARRAVAVPMPGALQPGAAVESNLPVGAALTAKCG